MDNRYKIMRQGVTKRGKENKWKWEIHIQETDILSKVRDTERRGGGQRGGDGEREREEGRVRDIERRERGE